MSVVSIRYARAFADVVLNTKASAKTVVPQLNAIVDLVATYPSLHHVWDNPSVPAEQKRGVLDAIVKDLGAAKIVRNFVAVIIDHRRVKLLPEIAKQVERELDDRLGIAEAEITTARDLNPQERLLLEQKIGAFTRKSVKATYQRDPKVLGGAVVRVGSTIYDGSVRGQLEKLREQLLEA
jgi:F-type H+-transporting ATPase subunit delta